MIITTKKQSATEAPKWMTNAWNKIRSGVKGAVQAGKDTIGSFKEAGRILSNKPTSLSDKALSSEVDQRYLWSKEDRRAWDKEFQLLTNSEKKTYLEKRMPSSITAKNRLVFESSLLKMSQPFTSDLYDLIVKLSGGRRGSGILQSASSITESNARMLIENARLFSKIFEKYPVKGINLANSDFQLKAIKYFFQKGADFKPLLKSQSEWKSAPEMRKGIDSLDEAEKKKLSNTQTEAPTMNIKDSEKIKRLKTFFERMPDNSITHKYSKYSEEDLIKAFDEILQVAKFIGEEI